MFRKSDTLIRRGTEKYLQRLVKLVNPFLQIKKGTLSKSTQIFQKSTGYVEILGPTVRNLATRTTNPLICHLKSQTQVVSRLGFEFPAFE
jgi:hypothetical protein